MLPCITAQPSPWLLAQASTLAMLQQLKSCSHSCSAMWCSALHPSRSLPRTCLALPLLLASQLVAMPSVQCQVALSIQQCPSVSHLPTSSMKESSTTASSTAHTSLLGQAWLWHLPCHTSRRVQVKEHKCQ